MRKVVLAFVAVYLGWGSTYLAIRVALESMPPFAIGGLRYLLAGPLMIVWALASGARWPTRIQWRSALIIGALLFLGGNGAVLWSQQTVPSSVVALLVASVPIFVAILRWQPLNARTLVGILGGIAGVAILVHPGAEGSVPWFETLLLMAGCISWAAGSLYTRTADLPPSPILAAGMQMFCGGALLLGLSLIHGELHAGMLSAITVRSIYAWLYLIIVGSVIAFTAYMYLLRTVPPEKASTYAYVNPIIAVLLGVTLGAEPFTISVALSAIVIIGSVILMISPRSRARGGVLS